MFLCLNHGAMSIDSLILMSEVPRLLYLAPALEMFLEIHAPLHPNKFK
jgi:hypothetical protein